MKGKRFVNQIPFITTQQMIEVDRLMVEDFGIQLIQMMENAGRNLTDLSRQLLGGDVRGKRIVVMCGSGNNGGGGMVAARHLHNWGARIELKLLAPKNRLKDIPAQQYQILEKMGIGDVETPDLEAADLIVDAMIGYGLTGNPRGSVADWIQQINASARPVLALDTPSGLDTTTGIPGEPCVRANATMTLALPKTGLNNHEATPFIGDLYLADISVPRELYQQMGIDLPPIFNKESIVKI